MLEKNIEEQTSNVSWAQSLLRLFVNFGGNKKTLTTAWNIYLSSFLLAANQQMYSLLNRNFLLVIQKEELQKFFG